MLTGILRMGGFALRATPRLWERITADRRRAILPAPHRPHPELWPQTGLHAAWLGHSTVLLKIDGVTILTDPVFSPTIGLGFGPVTIGLKRLVAPALAVSNLGGPDFAQPDILLLSHAHMDHWDIPSLRALESPRTTVVTAAKTADLLRAKNYGAVHELGWGTEARIGEIVIRAFEVRHWGARMQRDTFRGYNGYVIETPRCRVLFGGDTALTDTFRTVRTARPIDIAIMPIGAYDPWINAHCTPEQALAMADQAGAESILPVHHKTFELSREPNNEPVERLHNALGSSTDRLLLSDIGQEHSRS